MIRTQIQLPAPLYQEVKRIAQEQEMSLAEVVRRGVEQMRRMYPPRSRRGWSLPAAKNLGAFKTPVTDWREAANLAEPGGQKRI